MFVGKLKRGEQTQEKTLTNVFIKLQICWKQIRFDNLARADSLLSAFLHKALSVRTSNSFCFKLSRIFTSLIGAFIFSCYFQKVIDEHLQKFDKTIVFQISSGILLKTDFTSAYFGCSGKVLASKFINVCLDLEKFFRKSIHQTTVLVLTMLVWISSSR